MKRDLKWGETPWDHLSRDELLRRVQMYFSAVDSLRACMAVLRSSIPESPYWAPSGSGGNALAKGDAVVDQVYTEFDQEQVYRSFFRYADDLLFPGIARWKVCANGHMLAPGGDTCRMCAEPMRPLNWSDMDVSQEAS